MSVPIGRAHALSSVTFVEQELWDKSLQTECLHVRPVIDSRIVVDLIWSVCIPRYLLTICVFASGPNCVVQASDCLWRSKPALCMSLLNAIIKHICHFALGNKGVSNCLIKNVLRKG